MKEPVKIAFGKHAKVKAIVQAAYPGATTRRPVRIECQENCSVSDYWDGGSRTYASLVDLSKMESVSYSSLLARQEQNNPMKLPIGSCPLDAGFAMVEHSIFCGKDLGYTIIMNPKDIPIHIPEAASLLPKEMSGEEFLDDIHAALPEAFGNMDDVFPGDVQEIPEKF